MNLEISETTKDIREKLRRQEAMLAHAHVIARDLEGCITFWSAADSEIYGWSEAEALGRPCDELLRTLLPEPREALERRAQTAGTWEGELVHHDRRGDPHYVSTTWKPYYSDDGSLAAFIEINCDISRQKAAERGLRDRERDFSAFFHLSGAGNVLADATTGNFLTVNQTFCDLTGYSAEELSHLSGLALTHPDDRSRDEEGWAAALSKGQPHHTIEKRYVRKDGSIMWVSVTSTIIRDDTSEPLYAAGVVIDVGPRHQAMADIAAARQDLERRVAERTAALEEVNAELDQISKKFETLIDASPAAIIALDRHRKIEIWNPAAETLFGLREEEIRGKSFVELPIDWNFPDALEAVLLANGDGHAHLQVTTGHGRTLDLEIWSAPYPGLDGSAGGHVLLLLDETEKKFLERALLETGEREKRSIGQALQNGLAQHLVGATFAAQALSKELQRSGSPAADQAGNLARLINDSVLEARDLARGINPIEVDPRGLMSALQELAARTPTPSQAHIELRCEHPVLVHNAETALHVFRIAQEAVGSALRNAKATRVLIRLAEDAGTATLQVSDNGTADYTDEDAGIGLGIMKYRAQAIRGELSIETVAGSGTTVTCTFTSHA
jgi:PAS domain S-box-containing protein